MAAVMQRAANIDENNINVEQEHLTKLVIENKVRQINKQQHVAVFHIFLYFAGIT